MERANQTELDYVRVNPKDKDNWIDVMHVVEKVMRFSMHRSTGCVPYEVLYGLPVQWGPLNIDMGSLSNLSERWNQINNKAALENHLTRDAEFKAKS